MLTGRPPVLLGVLGLVVLSSPVSAQDNSPSFRGLRFGIDLRQQIGECPKKKTEHGTDYDKSISKTCWKQHPFCVSEIAVLEAKVVCGEPWIVEFADSLTGSISSGALVTQLNGGLAEISSGNSKIFTDLATMVDAELVRSRTAKDNAMQRYVKARDGGVRDQRLIALAQKADATARTALDVQILQLKVKLAYLTAEVKSEAFASIESLFRAKYGPPTISTEEPWQSKGGVRTESHIRAWAWNGLSIHLKSPDDDVDHASLIVATPQAFESLEREQSERFKRSLGDL